MNCKIIKNYFAEKARMTGATADNYGCMIRCTECHLSHCNNGENQSCSTLEMLYPEKAVEIVQKWSDEHPQKTLLDDLKEKYPNYQKSYDDVPRICTYDLGYDKEIHCRNFGPVNTCAECWNRPLDNVKANDNRIF